MLQNCRKVDLLIIPAGYNNKSDNNTNFNDNNHNYENKFRIIIMICNLIMNLQQHKHDNI